MTHSVPVFTALLQFNIKNLFCMTAREELQLITKNKRNALDFWKTEGKAHGTYASFFSSSFDILGVSLGVGLTRIVLSG